MAFHVVTTLVVWWADFGGGGGFALFRIFLFVRGDETIGVRKIRAEAGVGAETNGASAIFGLREEFGVRAEDASAQRDEGGARGFAFDGGEFCFGCHGKYSNRFFQWLNV